MKRYQEYIATASVTGDTHLIDAEKGKSISQQILKFSQSVNATYIVVGVKGGYNAAAHSKHIGRVTQGVMSDSQTTVITICKP
jgi:hypothetical protein